MSLHIHVFQHVEFEGPELIGDWAAENNHTLSFTRFFAGDSPPQAESIDMLIVMGGPMGVYDDDKYPWLRAEMSALIKFIGQGTPILGICLGAQLIAKALGTRVYPGEHKEIGWLPLQVYPRNFPSSLQKHIPAEPEVFHWHGDTFDLPEESILLASSVATPNQAFLYDETIIGLQFHLETTTQAVEKLIENAGDELTEGKYIQTPEQMRNGGSSIPENSLFLFAILNYLAELTKRQRRL